LLRALVCPKSFTMNNITTDTLSAIPLSDLRDGGPVRYAECNAERVRALRDACLAVFPRAVLPMVPALDLLSRRWLERSRSPYRPEIARIADALGFSGVWLLNASYQWGCTARACDEDGVPWLLRTLDWPFHGLGRHAEVARMRCAAGDFFSVTWPGYVGALTALAPSRFAACVNQAPMRRRTRHHWLRGYDLAANGIAVWRSDDLMPPDQLLRQTFELCADFAAARRMLESTPVARPVIYVLVGCAAGERCVIERTETAFITRENQTSAANDWWPCQAGWEGRIGTRRFFINSFAEAADYSRARRESLDGWRGACAAPGFDWVREPVLNPYTRLAVAMCPARGILRAAGYELTGAVLPEPVTGMFEVVAMPEPQAA
jgi:hypothetical protein